MREREVRSPLRCPSQTKNSGEPARSAAVLILAGYGIQFDNTFTTKSGLSGSLVFRWTAKLCGPSMPSCIMKTADWTIVLSPGLSAIEPMVNSGGQQPSTISMYGSSLNRRVPSPVLVTLMAKVLLTPNFTSP